MFLIGCVGEVGVPAPVVVGEGVVAILRALVKETMSRELVERLSRDIADACATLDQKGGAHESERRQVKQGLSDIRPGSGARD